MKKKLLVLTAMLLVVSTTIMSQTAFTVDGGIKTEWGYDIDTGATGFRTSLDNLGVKIENPFGENWATTESSNENYGKLVVGNIRLQLDGAKNDTDFNEFSTGFDEGYNVELRYANLQARLVLGDFALHLYRWAKAGSRPIELMDRENYNNDGLFQNAYDYSIFYGDYGEDDITLAGDKNSFTPFGAREKINFGDGIDLEYTFSKLGSIYVSTNSTEDWTVDEDDEDINKYNFTAGVALTPVEDLALELEGCGAFYDEYSETHRLTAAARVSYNFYVGSDISIAPVVGAEFRAPNDTDNTYDLAVAGGAKLDLFATYITGYVSYERPEETEEGDDSDVETFKYTISANVETIDYLTIQAAYERTTYDAVHAKVAYEFFNDGVTITPMAQYSLNNKDDADTYQHYIYAGVEAEGIFDNTTFGLNWKSNNIMADEDKFGAVIASVGIYF